MSTTKLATSKRTFTSCQQSASNVSEASSCAAAPSKRKKRRGEQHKAGKSQVIPVIISQQEKERSLKLNSSKAIKTLVTEKTYYFETSNRNQVIPYIREFFTSESQTVFTWPCAVLLASYIVTSNVTKNLRTIEIGAGCGLPSIVAAMCGASACVITERADEPLIMQNLEMNVSKNNLSDICSVVRNQISYSANLIHF